MEKLYRLAKKFKAYQFDDHFENCGLELERTHIRVGDYITLDTENMRIDAFSPAQFNRFFEAVNIND